MTQEMLCQAAGISLDAVSRIESGARAPTLETVEKLAHGLGVSVAQLLELSVVSGLPAFPPRVMRVACALATADDRLQRTAEDVVRVLMEKRRPRRRRADSARGVT